MEDANKLPATYMSIAPVSNDPNVWTDVLRMRTLNSNQTQKKLQNHVCPLQLDIVERIIGRFSNEGDLVMDPFGGLMTVPYMALKMKRKGMGIELNSDYFRDGLFYLRKIECELTAPTLFEFEEIA
jgi:DNA modification methylase